MSRQPAESIKTYEVNLAATTFGHDLAEMRARSEEAIELLRCCADGGDEWDEVGSTIEAIALNLDATLFVTLLARLWAQNSMLARNEPFENVKIVLLDAALLLEQSTFPSMHGASNA
jgi:hypothetical protein